jgi:hypothetical protein
MNGTFVQEHSARRRDSWSRGCSKLAVRPSSAEGEGEAVGGNDDGHGRRATQLGLDECGYRGLPHRSSSYSWLWR